MRKSYSKSKKLPKISPIKITRKSYSPIKKVESKKKSYSPIKITRKSYSPIKKSKKKSYSPIKKVESKKKSYSPIKKIESKKKSPIKKVKINIYCGNNLLSPSLIQNGGDCRLGTNYQCLKKGIGYGIYSPIDLEFINYEPIDPPENIYCGDKTPLPEQYERFGRRGTCLKKGVGIGKRIRLQREGLI
jgi:hypothetical protein